MAARGVVLFMNTLLSVIKVHYSTNNVREHTRCRNPLLHGYQKVHFWVLYVFFKERSKISTTVTLSVREQQSVSNE